jgi:hypothetical protein
MRRWLLFLAAIALLLHLRSVGYGFVTWDDGLLVFRNPAIRELSFQTLRHIFTSYDPELYIPLTFLSYQIEYQIAGFSPAIFHFTNVLLHALNTVLVFLIAGSLWRDRRIGFLVALLFAIHPLHTEAVSWISARKDLLSALFFLSSIRLYHLFVARVHEPLLRHWTLWLSIICFALSLLAKVSTVPLPLLLLLMDFSSGRKISRAVLLEKIPYVVLAVVFVVIAIVGKSNALSSLPFLSTLSLAMQATVFLLSKLLLPLGLSVMYPVRDVPTLLSPFTIIAATSIIAVLLVALFSWRKDRRVTLGIVWFFVMVAPMVATFAKGPEVALTSDRYAYLPSIGMLAILSLAGVRLWDRFAKTNIIRGIALGAFIVLLLLFSMLTLRWSSVWANSQALYEDALSKYPESASVHYNLGLEYQWKGKPDDAIAHYTSALALRPVYPDAHNNIGTILLDRGDNDGAIKELRIAIDQNPRHALAYANLAAVYGKKGMYEDAVRALQKSLELDPRKKKEAEDLRRLVEEMKK